MAEEIKMEEERRTSARINDVNRQNFGEGQHIFREGETGETAFIVISGNVGIYKTTESGETPLAVLKKGAMFGEMALINDEVRMASAKAMDGIAEVMVISRAMFQKKMDALDPFTRGLIKILSDNVRNSQK
ncbi:MAG: cyclic nucleotide-binding domain-containing protein [Rhodospirillales bacterium]|nr:cyclic nucleotide-binding domain-containing protein [Rhodospirillales bacterium]